MSTPDPIAPTEAPPVAQTFWRYVLDGMGAINFVAGGAIGILVGGVSWAVAPVAKFSAWVVLPTAYLLLWLLLTFIVALRRASDDAMMLSKTQRRILVRSINTAYPPHESSACVLLLEWIDTARVPIPIGSTVSVAFVEGLYEKLLGYGEIAYVQTDGYVVVALSSPQKGVEERIKNLLKPDSADQLAKLRIGTAVHTQQLDALRQHAVTSRTAANVPDGTTHNGSQA